MVTSFRFSPKMASQNLCEVFRHDVFSAPPENDALFPCWSEGPFNPATATTNSQAMIITRSPLRISLGGGGTDVPSYYREHGGFLISAAINKYVYIALHRTFTTDLILKYSQMERVSHVKDIKHPIIREAFKLLKLSAVSLEISSMADIPSGTGLGSSGSFTTALLKALYNLQKKHYPAGRVGATSLPH